MCKLKNETIVSNQFMPPVCMTRHTRPTYYGKASTKKQSEYKLINWWTDKFVYGRCNVLHIFLSVYFVIYLFILSSNWFFISCCSCSMRCKFCNFACTNQEGLFKHYRLRHGGGANWSCIYSNGVCTFRTHRALKTHLTRSHCRKKRRAETCAFLWVLWIQRKLHSTHIFLPSCASFKK